jgi:hypothetical protein
LYFFRIVQSSDEASALAFCILAFLHCGACPLLFALALCETKDGSYKFYHASNNAENQQSDKPERRGGGIIVNSVTYSPANPYNAGKFKPYIHNRRKFAQIIHRGSAVLLSLRIHILRRFPPLESGVFETNDRNSTDIQKKACFAFALLLEILSRLVCRIGVYAIITFF